MLLGDDTLNAYFFRRKRTVVHSTIILVMYVQKINFSPMLNLFHLKKYIYFHW